VDVDESVLDYGLRLHEGIADVLDGGLSGSVGSLLPYLSDDLDVIDFSSLGARSSTMMELSICSSSLFLILELILNPLF